MIEDLNHRNCDVGTYRALIIGIDDYQDEKISDLETAKNDALAIVGLLRKKYGFQINPRTDLLLDRKATQKAIYTALRELAVSTRPTDNVLIYYAGHGDWDKTYNDGYWIPADADAGDPLTYLDNIQVQRAMRNMKARHVLLISDSCYAGTLFGKSRSLPPVINDKYYLGMFNEKSRWGLTSGNKTPVSDKGTEGHSIFAYQLLKALRNNAEPYLSTQELFTRIAPIISNNSQVEQVPRCHPILRTGDQGGQFIFIVSGDLSEGLSGNPQTLLSATSNVSIPKIDVDGKYAGNTNIRLKHSDSAKKFTNSLGMTFVHIPSGTFIMGSSTDEAYQGDDEGDHRVTLTNGFYLQTTEVTQGQWKAVMVGNPAEFKNCGGEYPVENVSWNDVQAFIKRLNQKEESVKYRLPTEAEWEYAARAGSKTSFFTGDISKKGFWESPSTCSPDRSLDLVGWYCGNADNSTHPVARKAPNAWGLYDMHGNVWEWCGDRYGEYSNGSIVDPQGNSSGEDRVLRGGGWYDLARYCRSAYRTYNDPDYRCNGYGVRLAACLSSKLDR